MQRRTVLAGAAGALAGCNRGDSESDDSPQGGARRVGPTPDESELPEMRGEWLEAESDSDVEVTDHVYHYTGQRMQPFVVSGMLVQTNGQAATVKVSVTFLDEDGTVMGNNYDLVRDWRAARRPSSRFSTRAMTRSRSTTTS